TYEVAEFVPGERLVIADVGRAVSDGDDVHVGDTANGGTRMVLRNRGEPTGFPRLAAPLMAPAMGRANRSDLARLKEILERTPPASGVRSAGQAGGGGGSS